MEKLQMLALLSSASCVWTHVLSETPETTSTHQLLSVMGGGAVMVTGSCVSCFHTLTRDILVEINFLIGWGYFLFAL